MPSRFPGEKESAPDFVLVEFEGIGTPSPKKKAKTREQPTGQQSR